MTWSEQLAALIRCPHSSSGVPGGDPWPHQGPCDCSHCGAVKLVRDLESRLAGLALECERMGAAQHHGAYVAGHSDCARSVASTLRSILTAKGKGEGD